MFQTTKNKVHFTSLGCPRNLVDTEVMLGILLRAGFEVVQDTQEADYLVVNTCGFLASARQESLDTIQSLLDEKKPEAKVVVTGCMVRNHKEEIKREIPSVNYLLGSGDVTQILELITQEEGELISSRKSYLQSGEVPRQLSTPKHYAYLKIAEGCRKACAFCIIPKIKGPLKSKTREQVLKEFQILLNQGVFEIILIAQDLGDFGKERKEPQELTLLLKEMLAIKKNFWIRLLYLYPDEITDELISLIQSDPRICPYLDMPIQHVNDEILKAMKRKTSKKEIVSTLEKLRAKIPGIVIRTSLMVGFPGESEEQFEELREFVKTTPLDNVGVFKFSREKGAAAYDLPDQVQEEVKEARYQALMQTQQDAVEKRLKSFIGKELQVILEAYHEESRQLMVGRFYGQCPEIDGVVILNDHRHARAFGALHKVKITGTAGYDLVGTILPETRIALAINSFS